MSHRSRPGLLLLSGVLVLLLGTSGKCTIQTDPLESFYTLGEGSRITEGCFAPCLCPAWSSDLQGSFRLRETPLLLPGLRAFSVQDVDWRRVADASSITGLGAYTIFFGGQDEQQRMDLSLAFGDEPARMFHSGDVPADPDFPQELDITLSQNDGYCYDTIIEIRAVQVF